MFKRNHVKAKITTSEFNRFGHRNLALYGLDDDDYVNMFDFLPELSIMTVALSH
ncbi:hypothetical protein SDC49_21455 [Lactobacillus sp. R2/2]|nr:hypothetical protein [Lactobacillus sp. R2/2]